MKIRIYQDTDSNTISKLYYETIHNINIYDYSDKQLNAWVNSSESLQLRRKDLLKQYTLIAEIDDVIVGFGSIDSLGCLDLLFVHKDYQRKGIATALCNELEKGFTVVKTYSSITAKPFFEKRGYVAVKCQEAERLGVNLKNFEMEKKNAT
ncbi:MAG: GNAT family N-acetyltransferase [Treponema brennaborense]|nr:GNAT family N-acetyltransferase [Muribaculaceae bacterium]MCM1408111.1 GNAT family N-acetyltransferase [Treponema brennaborense]